MKELSIDLKDYLQEKTVFKRNASRGIITQGDKILVIQSKYGEYKFPGGGVEENETLEQALIREVCEETGCVVKEDSIQLQVVAHEKRKGMTADVMLMDSYYFTCEIENELKERNLDAYEIEYGFQACWISLKEAYEHNKSITNEKVIPWIKRDTTVMELLLEEK